MKKKVKRKFRLPNDPIYKQFFSKKLMVISFIKSFAPEVCVYLDLETLERCNSNFINSGLSERRSDVIWRARRKDKSWCYIFLLLEFQSSCDHYMAYRIAEYSSLLLREIAKSGATAIAEGSPLTLPIVIYNGDSPWNAPTGLEKMLISVPDKLYRFQLRQDFLLVDIRRLSQDMLKNATGISSNLARLEQFKNIDDLRNVVKDLLRNWNGQEYDDIRGIFAEYINTFLYQTGKIKTFPQEMKNLEKVDIMLETNFREWENDTLQKGILIGRTEGITVGKAEGKLEGMAEEREDSLRKSISRLHKIGLANDQIVLAIVEDFDLSKEQAQDKILQYLN